MLLSPFCNITGKEVASAEEVPTSHPGRIKHLHKDFTGDRGQVTGVSVKVDILVLIDIRCICVLEFLGSGTPQLFVSVDTLLN